MNRKGVRQERRKKTTSFPLFFLGSVFFHIIALLAAVLLPSLFKTEPKKTPPITMVQVVSIQQPKRKKPSTQKAIPKKQVQKKKEASLPKKPKEAPKKVTQKDSMKPLPSKVAQKDSLKRPLEKMEEVAEEPPPPKTQIASQNKVPPSLKFWMSRVGVLWDSRWNPPTGIGIVGIAEGQVQATVLRSGVITNMKLIQSSGNAFLDKQAKEALTRIGRFPPIPANYREKEQLIIHFIFKYYGDSKN